MNSDFITVEDAKLEGLIPEPFHSYFKNECTYCKKSLIINYATTIMKCGNPGCYRRVAMQATDLLHDLHYKGYGPESLTSYCKSMHITRITDFIRNPPSPLNLVEELNTLHLNYPTLVKYLHIPHLGTRVFKLFAGVDSYNALLNLLLTSANPEQALATRAGGPVLAQETLELFEEYGSDLEEITELVHVVPQAKHIMNIAITGHLTFNGGCTKDAYVYLLNQIAKDAGIEVRRSDAVKSVMYIVADSPSNSRKYKVGLERNNLITSTELYAGILKLCQTYGTKEAPNDN